MLAVRRRIFFKFLNQIQATVKIFIREIILLKNLNVFGHFHEALVGKIITCFNNSMK